MQRSLRSRNRLLEVRNYDDHWCDAIERETAELAVAAVGALPLAGSARGLAFQLADSLVVNAHKWLFTPMDCSLLWTRNPEALRAAFSLVPEFLRTPDEEDALSLSEYGPVLGRRFRSLVQRSSTSVTGSAISRARNCHSGIPANSCLTSAFGSRVSTWRA